MPLRTALGLQHAAWAESGPAVTATLQTPRGLVTIDISTPTAPRVLATVGAPALNAPRAVTVQFRYAFVIDAQGLKVIDVTDPMHPRAIPGAVVPLDDARDLYVARTYAYVAAGRQGLALIDVEHAEHPRLDQLYTAGGQIDDARGIKVGMTNASLFAYLADGIHGLRIIQLMSPNTPGATGFSPRPAPISPIWAWSPPTPPAAPRSRYRAGSTATGPPTKAATSSSSSADAGPDR